MHTSEPVNRPKRSVFRKLVRITIRVILTVIIILIIVVFLIQTPYVQDIIRGKAEKYLSRKLNTRVRIGKLNVRFPETILLKDIYVEDRQKDTLLSVGLIGVDMRMWALLHSSVEVNVLRVADCTVKVGRQLPDTTFNYQFIVDAFAGGEKKPVSEKPSKPMKIAVGAVELDSIRLVYRDGVGGDSVAVWLGSTRVDKLGYDPSAAVPLQVGRVGLDESRINYRNTVSAMFFDLQEGHLVAAIKVLDLDQRRINLDELRLDSTTAAIRMGKPVPRVAEKGTGVVAKKGAGAAGVATKGAAADSSGDWQILAGSLRLNGDNFRFDNDLQSRQSRGMDYAHLKIDGLTLEVSRLLYNKDSIAGNIIQGRFKEQCGFQLDGLKTDFLYATHQSYLKGLELKTPGSLLRKTIVLRYSSLEGIVKDPVHALIDADLPDNKIQVKDILTFVPSLRSQPAFARPNAVWQINARLQGSLDNLQVKTLRFSGLGDTRVDVAGTVRSVTDPKKINGSLDIRNISGSRNGLVGLLPPHTLPSNISLPARFDMKGKLDGGMDGIRTDMVLHSSSGSVTVKGMIRQFRDMQHATYDARIGLQALDLGAILQDTLTWGKFTAEFGAKGKGIDLHTANTVFDGHVVSATVKGFEYNELQLNGSLANGQAELQSSILDTAIRFTLKASADLSKRYPGVKLDWQIDTLDLHTLRLVKDTLTFRGHLAGDFADTNPDSLQGKLTIDSIVMVKGDQRLATDSIELLAERSEDIEDIRLRSEMADMEWKGRYKLTEVGKALQSTLSRYYRMGSDTAVSFTAQDWRMDIHLRPSPLVLTYLPDLKGTDTIGLTTTYNSDKQDLQLSLQAPKIQYGSQVVNKASVQIATGEQQLQYAVRVANATTSGLRLDETSIYGHVANDQVATTLLLKDADGKNKYRLSGLLNQDKDVLKWAFNPDSLVLNYDPWQVAKDNYIRYDSAGLVVNDLKLGHGDESLRINSNQPDPSAPIDVEFTNFRMGTLSRFAGQDSLLVDGILNGKAQVSHVMTSPVFTSDLLIKDLVYRKDSVGDLAIKVNNEKANAFSADISLKGNKNDVRVKGDYYTGEGRMDMKLDLGQLNLAIGKAFAGEQLTAISGFLKGSLAVSGTLAAPVLNGNLHFDSAHIKPAISGEPLTLSNDKIEFDKDGFNFSEFAFTDASGNKATIDGNVYTKDYRKYGFSLNLRADDFRLVNALQASNKEFYGKLNLDASVNLNGDMESPKVDGFVRINKQTDFTFVLPSSNPEVVDREGVVRFVQFGPDGDTVAIKHEVKTTVPRESELKGMDISLRISTDSSAIFTMVIDERSGDALTARGNSNLVFGMDKGGKMDMTGTYEVESGSYNLSLDVLKRKFDIQRGSTLTWTGDPTSATLDINATYTANTPSIDLIANEIAGRTAVEVNKFKQKLPFLVTLKMEGELLKPKITFDITLPANVLTLWPDVDQKLQQIRVQESELNKQVFALLLLNRFVGDDPLQSAAGGGTNIGNMAFQSASQILTGQLDQLAASLIKGVEIHFDLNNQQDFSTGTEQDYTELNVTVSKRFFNDRIQVNVGSNFDVQGTGNPNQNASNIAGDVAVDYKLSEDGRYMLRAYRKNQYEAVIEGQVVETGVSFILTFDYRRFREIFMKTRRLKIGAPVKIKK